MTRYLLAYLAVGVALFALDMLWLRGIATPWYQQGIGHLMGAEANLYAAGVFYLLYPVGLMVFAVAPHSAASWVASAAYGAAFGFFAYATYDLTNLATLKGWPLGLSLLDVAWGSLVSGVSAVAGRFALG